MSVQTDNLVFFDAPDIALVAHGDIAVVAPQEDLGTLGDNVALTVPALMTSSALRAIIGMFK